MVFWDKNMAFLWVYLEMNGCTCSDLLQDEDQMPAAHLEVYCALDCDLLYHLLQAMLWQY